MAEEPKKEKVITGEKAVALGYDPSAKDLPKILAKGQGELAEELIRLAIEHRIPIKYDPDLVQILSTLDVGQALPEELFVVVAEVLAFVYWVNQEFFSSTNLNP